LKVIPWAISGVKTSSPEGLFMSSVTIYIIVEGQEETRGSKKVIIKKNVKVGNYAAGFSDDCY